MSIPFSQRWVALLAAPLVALSAVTLHLAAAAAANEHVTPATAQQTMVRTEQPAQRSSNSIAQRSSGLTAQRSSGLIAQRSSGLTAQRSSGLTAQRSSGLIAQRSSGLIAQRSRIQRVRFAPGSDSATIKTSVVNGTRDLYLLGAQKGQVMSIRIVSLEDNAVFDIVAPPNSTGKRQTLKQEAFTWSSTLPETGDYQIVVGSTRGNASYRLQITIR